mmetsp:Transcript_2500/g.6020  ORF Transcript_2500/g.6020 Transcript_2500/m.6020 type:complete len:200 (+) Transcript_2500:299-898(+)
MHITQSVIQLQLCYHFCNCLLLVGFLGGCISFVLALMTLYGAIGIRSAFFMSFSGFFGLVRLIMPPWSSLIAEEDSFLSIQEETKRRQVKLSDLAVDTRKHAAQTKDSCNFCTHDSSCSICLQGFEIGEEISRVSHCKHAFHSDCLRLWAQKSTTCPYCRQDMEKRIPPKEESKTNRLKLPGALGIFDGALDSIFDLAS